MSYNRLPKRNKVSKPEDVLGDKGGKKYKVLTIGGAKVEVAADVFTF